MTRDPVATREPVVARDPGDGATPPAPTGWGAWRRPRVGGAVAALALVVVAVLIAAATGVLPWRDYVERRPASYVALSFADPAGLPTTAAAGQPVDFAFDLTNPAHEQRNLHWTVAVHGATAGGGRELATGSTVVPARGQVRTPQHVVLDSAGRQQVTVTLDTGEVIAFYVTVAEPRGVRNRHVTPMHVLHVTKRWPDAKGGDAVVARNLVRRQREAGHRVTVLTSRCPTIRRGPGVLVFGLPVADADLDHINLRRVVSLLGLVLRSVFLLRRLRPDVVHVHAVDLGIAVSVAARIWRIPLVLTLHGTALGSPFLSPAKQRLEGALIRSAGYRVVLSVTEEALAQLTALGGTLNAATVRYLPNAIVLEDFPSTPVPDAGPLLFVGRLERVKGLDVLLRALAGARSRGADLELRLAGSGSEAPRLGELADELGIRQSVEFLGALDEPGIRDELARCRAFVLPSRYEGFPLVLLEAWASGRAVVATRVGAVPQVCTDGTDALTVPADDAEQLEVALVRLDDDPDLVRRLGACGRRQVEERYSDRRMAAAVEDVYREVLDRVPCNA